MKRVVSVSLGTSKRDKTSETELLGERFAIERRGTDGSLDRFAALFGELDGKVDALGVGGCDIYVVVGKRRYAFRQILRLIEGARTTPVVDGSGLKHTLERSAIERLQKDGVVDFSRERALLVSAVDRYGMAQALDRVCPKVVFGDLLFGLGLPIPLTSYRQVEKVGRLFLPIVTRLPFKWFYPTGKQQEDRKPKHPKVFAEATFLCGDWHYIRRYAPDRLDGKTILTQTLRTADLEWLKEAGARRAITTTPVIGGETFATNVMEAAMVTLIGKRPADTTEQDYLTMLDRLDWSPTVIPLNEE
ncbi:MAG: hypothetical protein KIS66_16520 [Fimbriimonadaceae bacterium]|nr:hypothetical protein [Fimbriimonadaceae bacterium]